MLLWLIGMCTEGWQCAAGRAELIDMLPLSAPYFSTQNRAHQRIWETNSLEEPLLQSFVWFVGASSSEQKWPSQLMADLPPENRSKAGWNDRSGPGGIYRRLPSLPPSASGPCPEPRPAGSPTAVGSRPLPLLSAVSGTWAPPGGRPTARTAQRSKLLCATTADVQSIFFQRTEVGIQMAQQLLHALMMMFFGGNSTLG